MSQSMNQTQNQQSLLNAHEAQGHQQVLHEAIIDLYLQVKVRSSDEIDRFGQDQFKKERERLLKFDSLTVLDYIKTSIEILMQIKDEGIDINDKTKKDKTSSNPLGRLGMENLPMDITNRGGELNNTGLSSTFKSIDLPPKEYEQQLQQYEAEVRNHIKVEQQLKLHIEVLNERIEEFEKEKDELKLSMQSEFQVIEQKLKDTYLNTVDKKQSEIARINDQMRVAGAQIKQLKQTNIQVLENNKKLQSQILHQQSQSQQQQTGGQADQKEGGIQFRKFHPQIQQQNSSNRDGHNSSQSPNANSSTQSGKKILPKPGHKNVSGLNGKSPYINDCYNKLQIGQQNTSNNSVNSGNDSSKSAQSQNSHQSMRKGSLDGERDRSFNSSNGGRTGSNDRVLKLKIQKKSGLNPKMPQQSNQQQVIPGNQKKIIATIQRIRQGGSQTSTQIANMQNGNQATHVIQSVNGGGQIRISQNTSQRTSLMNQENNAKVNHLGTGTGTGPQKHKKNKSQLSFTNGEHNAKANNIQFKGNSNFGPVQFHNNSGGMSGSQEMILDSNGNMMRQVSDQILSQQISVHDQIKRPEDMLDEHNQMLSSSMSIKTAQKKAMKNQQQMEQYKIMNGQNISQSSVISTNTNHKISQEQEISVQSTNVNQAQQQQVQKILLGYQKSQNQSQRQNSGAQSRTNTVQNQGSLTRGSGRGGDRSANRERNTNSLNQSLKNASINQAQGTGPFMQNLNNSLKQKTKQSSKMSQSINNDGMNMQHMNQTNGSQQSQLNAQQQYLQATHGSQTSGVNNQGHPKNNNYVLQQKRPVTQVHRSGRSNTNNEALPAQKAYKTSSQEAHGGAIFGKPSTDFDTSMQIRKRISKGAVDGVGQFTKKMKIDGSDSQNHGQGVTVSNRKIQRSTERSERNNHQQFTDQSLNQSQNQFQVNNISDLRTQQQRQIYQQQMNQKFQ